MVKIKNLKFKILFRGFLLAFLVFGFWFLVFDAGAQTFPDFGSSQINDFDISVSNRHPFPNEKIAAKIVNANFDVARSNIKWILNGKIILQGKNESEAAFEVGEAGSSASLTASILTPMGERARKSVVLKPTDIDLLWQADTYIPYFYKGKSIVSPLSKVTVAAIPYFVYQGNRIAPRNLLFKWYLNNDFKARGWGKDSFTFKTGLFNGEEYEIRVEISSATEKLVQERSLRITAQSPQIIFYEYSPFEGIRAQKAISSFKAASGEYIQFIAEIYFAPNDKLKELVYKWKINNEKLENSKPFNVLDFSSAPGASGSVFVDLTVSFKDLLEKISSGFNVQIQ